MDTVRPSMGSGVRVDFPVLTGTIIDEHQRRWCGRPVVIVTVQPDTLWRRAAPEPAAEVDTIVLRFPIERAGQFVLDGRIEVYMHGRQPGFLSLGQPVEIVTVLDPKAGAEED